MFSSNNYNNNGVYADPVAFLFSPFSSHDDVNLVTAAPLHHHHHHQIHTPSDFFMAHHHHHQLNSSAIHPNQMVPTTSIDHCNNPEEISMTNYKAFFSNNMVVNLAHEHKNLEMKDCSDKVAEVIRQGKKPPLKKDRHSKIHTAQGIRDRRVRLSIGIAREFFDLQDMLGFDKASKTLEWLLRKSRKAIKELVQAKKHNDGCYNNINNEDHKDFHTNGNDDNEEEEKEDVDGVSGSSSEYCKDLNCFLDREKRMNNESKNISKGLRVKAKDQRTKEKARDHQSTATQSQILKSSLMNSISQNEVEESLSTRVPSHGQHHQNITSSFYKQILEDSDKFLLERSLASNKESIFIKNKIKSPVYNQQNGGDMLKHLSSSGDSSSSNLYQNWDINYYHNLLGDSPFFWSQ